MQTTKVTALVPVEVLGFIKELAEFNETTTKKLLGGLILKGLEQAVAEQVKGGE